VVAEAVVVAVQRLYLAPDADSPTGLLRIDEIKARQEGAPRGAGSREVG